MGWPELGRDDEALCELIANRRRLTPSVKDQILELVRSCRAYLFRLGGGMWIFVASRFLEVLGISIRDHPIERNNLAALVAVCGILSGVGIVNALSNFGA